MPPTKRAPRPLSMPFTLQSQGLSKHGTKWSGRLGRPIRPDSTPPSEPSSKRRTRRCSMPRSARNVDSSGAGARAQVRRGQVVRAGGARPARTRFLQRLLASFVDGLQRSERGAALGDRAHRVCCVRRASWVRPAPWRRRRPPLRRDLSLFINRHHSRSRTVFRRLRQYRRRSPQRRRPATESPAAARRRELAEAAGARLGGSVASARRRIGS